MSRMADEKEQPPATPPTNPAPEEPAAKGEDKIDEKSTKLAFLKQFRGLNAKDKEDVPQGKTAAMVTQEEATEQVYKKIVEIKSSDYWIIRIKKRSVLLIIGLLIGAMWLILIGQKAWQRFGGTLTFSNGMVVIEHEVNQPQVTESIPEGPLIRIRNTQLDDEGAQTLQTLLEEKGFMRIELVPDTESTLSGISIVVKPDNNELLSDLTSILEASYRVSSPAAALTQDSDFDAVIFYGIDAKK